VKSAFPVAAALLVLAGSGLWGGCAAPTAQLAGRVVRDGSPIGGARVTLDSASAQSLIALTDTEGVYRFDAVPPGTYTLSAEGAEGAGLVPAWGIAEIVLAPGQSSWEGLPLVPRAPPRVLPYTPATPGSGAVSGTVMLAGEPVVGAVANLYLDRAEGLKGQGVRQSPLTGGDGRFALEDLTEGAYYLTVRKRRSGTAGPVREGDLYGVAATNPIMVRAGTEVAVTVHVARKEKERPPQSAMLARTGTAVTGVVTDDGGQPLAGVYVFAYRDRTIGHRMPDFLSAPTGPDGRFVLPLGDGGLFYLGAREHFGGSPQPGERFGLYEGSPDHGLRIARGKMIEDVEIRVREVLAP